MSALRIRPESEGVKTFTIPSHQVEFVHQNRLVVDVAVVDALQDGASKPGRRVVWDAAVIDNELMNKKSSKSTLFPPHFEAAWLSIVSTNLLFSLPYKTKTRNRMLYLS